MPLKLKNPALPILIRECSGVSPKIWARYSKNIEWRLEQLLGFIASVTGYGKEDVVDLSGLRQDDVLNVLNSLDKNE